MASEKFSNPSGLPQTPDGWRVAAIDELCIRVTSGATPLRSNAEFYKDGTLSWFKTQELRNGIVYDSNEKITAHAVEKTSAKLFPPNTVLMAMYGDGKTITSLAILGKEAATNQACCAMIADSNFCDPKFLFYALKHHRSDFLHIATGGAQRNLSGMLIKRFAIAVPPLAEQRAIVHVLSSLDEKIEMNRKMNETLEAMARALFKSWFVDFDPVRAKAEGRDSGLPASIAVLFPDSFGDREPEQLPKGWKQISLYQIAEFSNGAAYRDMHFSPTDEGLPVIKIAELKAGVTDSTRFTTTELGSKYRIDQKEILFSWSGNPDTSIDTFIWDGGPAWLNQHIFRVRENGTASRTWIYCLLKSLRYVFAEIARNKQTTGLGHVTIADLKKLMVCQPSPDVAKAFDTYAAPILERVFSNQLQINFLKDIRDNLLPKLISGEIRVGEQHQHQPAEVQHD